MPRLSSKDKITEALAKRTHYSKNDNDLINIHIGNPLRRITQLLEDIKKQKAFSFSLKGSLGLAGLVLTMSVFGIFGGSKLFCDHGRQTQIGTLQTLLAEDPDTSTRIPGLTTLLDFLSTLGATTNTRMHPRVILVHSDYSVINIPYSRFIDVAPYEDKAVIATGNYDSCSQKLTITDSNDLQPLQN